jgi:hypothetical protein
VDDGVLPTEQPASPTEIARAIPKRIRRMFPPVTGAVLASPPVSEPFCSSGYQRINWVGGGGAWFIDDTLPPLPVSQHGRK